LQLAHNPPSSAKANTFGGLPYHFFFAIPEASQQLNNHSHAADIFEGIVYVFYDWVGYSCMYGQSIKKIGTK